MSWPSGPFTSENPSLFSYDSSNQTQEISQIGEQNGDMQHQLRIFNMGGQGQGQGQGSFNATEDDSNQTQEISPIGEQNVVQEMVGSDLGKSSNRRQKKLRSEVWNNFEKYTDGNGKDWAKCNICKKPFNGSSKLGTSHLQNHFNSCSKKKKIEGGGSGSGDKPAENSVMDQQLNRLDMVKMHIKQLLPWEFLPKSIEAADITSVYNEEKEKLCLYLKKLPCRLSLVTKTDLSRFGEYICFLVYFIDDDWKLKGKIISLKCIGGDPIKKILKNVLSEWGIDNNISYMLLDDYSYDDVMSSNERENWFSSQGSLLFNDKLFCIRGFHYILSIYSDCKEDIEGIIYYHLRKNFDYITGNEKLYSKFLSAIDRALGKKVKIPTEEDLKFWDIDDLVETGLGLKEAFFELEKMDIEFKSINLTKEDWDLITTFYDLNEENDWYRSRTANMYFPWLCSTYMMSLEFLKLKSFFNETESVEFIEEGRGLKRWYEFMEGMKCWKDDNLVLAVATVLDPRFKMDIVEYWYKKIYGGEYEKRLEKFKEFLTRVYNEYAKGTNDMKSDISYKMLDPSGKRCKFSHDRSLNIELNQYLEDIKFPSIQDFDIQEWWRFNARYFPTLARMARDFLSFPILFTDDVWEYIIPGPDIDFDSDMVKEAAVCAKDWL